VTGFDRLHPALQHHIVNTLGWKALRPLQEQAIPPLLDGAHALLLAPTAGGKTEAAVFPLLSRMLAEGWKGLSVLYVCPIRALLNNLEIRLSSYAALVGRRVERWHGDVGEGDRRRIRSEPPDILLTTPESIEVMLVSSRIDRAAFFADVRAVVVDELHAFAGDDRGWHLLAVLERVGRHAGRELQRVGLSATIGNPDELLGWLAGACAGQRVVVAPPADSPAKAEVGLDFVGTLENAATLIRSLHRGEKRLVFVDSRSRVEELAATLRDSGVDTYVSHSSLSLDERRRAEQAFAEGRDCVIVATSALELGIDVGDLDRVIQIDAPTTVASFLQRLGRTGRRPGTTRNCLFLATDRDAFLTAAGLIQLHHEGFVEPVTPPPEPLHVFAQQILALILQQRALGRSEWRAWVGRMPAFQALPVALEAEIFDHMLATEILASDQGVLGFGREGEKTYGSKNYLELFSVFSTLPLFTVLHGRTDLGRVHHASFQAKQGALPILLLGGRSWLVNHIDWDRGIAYVEPTADRGRSRWPGDGRSLSFALCRAIRRVLTSGTCPGTLTSRATAKLDELASDFSWLHAEGTTLLRSGSDDLRWWTFAGLRANGALAAATGLGARQPDNLSIPLDPATEERFLRERLRSCSPEELASKVPVPQTAVAALKFSCCLPEELLQRTLSQRWSDPDGVRTVLGETIQAAAVA
jgi:ATP-dependent Lhr-like helicase